MKFTDGYWSLKKGVQLHSPVCVPDVNIAGKTAKVFAACRPVRHRGDTLSDPLLTISYFSPMEDVIGVRITHHAGRKKKPPSFALTCGTDVAVDIQEDADTFVYQSGKLRLCVYKEENWHTEYTYDGRRLTGNQERTTGYLTDGEGNAYVREQLELDVDECVYGLGERFTPFVKNGQSVDIWNEDGGTASEQAYKNVPFYLTNHGYGVFVNDPGRVSFEVASEVVSRVQFSVPGETMEYYIIGGETLKDVLRNYTELTGKPALPPAWSFGLWLTTSFVTSYDEDTVNSFIGGMAERELPLHVFHFDCFWMKEYQWCDFTWDPDVFPAPREMLDRLKGKGLKICVWINPYIAQKSRLFDEGAEKGYLLKDKKGNVWQWDMWQAGMGIVDFTNPDAVAWYQSKLTVLLDMGVDCFKTDFGERIPTDVVYHDGSDPEKMHNYYSYLYNKAVFDLLLEKKGEEEAVLFARSATAGGQQFPVHWGGDCTAKYASMAESLRGGLSLSLSGFGFWSHDIGGFERTAAPDLYKRWVAFGMLSSHSRLHGNESYRVPWLFDEEAVDVLRFFTNLKCSLMPYIFAGACEAASEGVPLMRAMVLEFPHDPACAFLDKQYMLGDSLLVSPIFNDRGEVTYYLPEGEWTHFLTGKVMAGGRYLQETYDYMSLPLMVRPDSIIAVGENIEKPDYDYADGVTFHVFALSEGNTAKATVYDTGASPVLAIAASRTGDEIIITAGETGKPWSVLLRGIPSVKSVSNGTDAADALGTKIVPDAGAETIIVTL